MTERLILFADDDGPWAPRLALPAQVAARFGWAVAPDRNGSGTSSALSLRCILCLIIACAESLKQALGLVFHLNGEAL